MQLAHDFSLVLLAAATHCARLCIIARVPFPFHVGDSLLLAGQYITESGIVPGMIVLKSADSKLFVPIFYNSVQSNTAPAQSKLIFTKYGSEYFLFQVWTAASDRG